MKDKELQKKAEYVLLNLLIKMNVHIGLSI